MVNDLPSKQKMLVRFLLHTLGKHNSIGRVLNCGFKSYGFNSHCLSFVRWLGDSFGSALWVRGLMALWLGGAVVLSLG